MTCTCGYRNDSDAKYCGFCGEVLRGQPAVVTAQLCHACQRPLRPTDRFCSGCRVALPSVIPNSYTPDHLVREVLNTRSAFEGEQKHVTVMFADLVGFTAITEKMERATKSNLETVRQIVVGALMIIRDKVHEYKGNVNQFLGDGAMALFGAPLAQEDHPGLALRAALAISEELVTYAEEVQRKWGVQCRLRIGINTGVTLVGAIGDNIRHDYTATGDATNVASRLQHAAEPGEIWVSYDTHKLAESDFEWEALEPRKVRNREELVHAYKLLGLRRTTLSKFERPSERGLTPFTGREKELRTLLDAWSEARAGRGQVVSVEAEAGLGKTRLLHEFKRSLGPQEGVVLCEGSCFDYGTTSAYLPFRELLKSLLHLEGVKSEADGASRVARNIAELGLEPTVAAAISNVLSYAVPEEFRATSAQVVRDRTVAGLRELVKALTLRRPLVLVIEDLHWIDEATQQVVTALVDDAAKLRLLLVLVFRPEYLPQLAKASPSFSEPEVEADEPRELGSVSRIKLLRSPETSAEMVRAVLSRPHATGVALKSISTQQSNEMVRQILDAKSVPRELELLVSSTAQGTPLFIEELVLSLIERGALVRRGEEWVLDAAPDTLRVPERVQNLFAARVDRLDEGLKELLKVASVMGRVFSPAILSQVSHVGAGDLDSSLRQLEALELIYKLPDSAPLAYSFKHALCQEAVYEQIRISKRQQFHGDVARVMEQSYADRLDEHCELLAHHYGSSSALDKAIDYLRMANRKAIRMSAMADAKKYHERARTVLAQLPDGAHNKQRRLELVLDQVFVALALFEYRNYYALLGEHWALAETLADRRLLGAFHARVGWCEWSIGDFAAGIQTLNRAVEHCQAAGNDEDLGFALMTRAWCELDRGDFLEALESCHEAYAALGRKFDLQSHVRTGAAATAVYAYLGRWKEGIEEGKRAIEIAERYGDPGAASFAAVVATWNYAFMGDLEQALATANFALSKATAPADQLFAIGSLALVKCRMGNAAEAAESLKLVVDNIRPLSFPACETFGLYYGEALLRNGELPRAKKELLECLKVIEPADAKFYVACAHRLLAEVALAEGGDQLSASGRLFEASMATLEGLGAKNELALAWAGYGRLQQKLNEPEAAKSYSLRALRTFNELGTRVEPDRVRRALAELGHSPEGDNV